MNKNKDVEKIVFAAILTSMALVIKIMFFYIPLPTVIKNVDIFIIFIVFSGILLGPMFGGFVGIAVDLIYLLVVGGDWGFFTLAHFSAGFIPGVFFLFLKYDWKKLIIVLLITLSVYFTITLYALYFYYGWVINVETVSIRLPRYFVTFIISLFAIHFLVTDARLQTFAIYKHFNKKNGKTIA
ncbi:MAG TPA: folate family ECF transporter S component [Clostridiaceae bacterium]|nr:folate family ECF transporter S component [Clostridiaceae bacterium]